MLPAVFSLLLAGCWVSSGATDVRLFPFVKDVNVPAEAAKKVAVFNLDGELLSATADDYSNMRLFDEGDNEKPFLVRTAKTAKVETSESRIEMESVGFQKLPDNKVELIYTRKNKENDAGKVPFVVMFSTTLKNYEKQVTVWGSNDRSSWEMLAENQPIFDYSRYVDVRNCRVTVKAGNYVYYRIMVSNITENRQSPLVGIARETRNGSLVSEVEKSDFRREDFRMDRIDFIERKETTVRSKVLTRNYPVKNMNVTNNVKDKITVITFDSGRAPLTAIRVLTASANFSRSLKVECIETTGANAGSLRFVAAAGISRIDAGGFKQDNVTTGLGGALRRAIYRVTIDNQDNPPLDVSGVEVEGEMHEAVFFPERGRLFHVMYGAAGLDFPRYDIVEVLARVEGSDADLCKVGEQKENPKYSAAGARLVDGRKLLVIAVLLMVAGLVWVIAKTVKSV